jgi:hypothetical protein
MRQVLTLAIVASWMVMAALLVQRHTLPTAVPLSLPASGSVDERDEWFGVYAEESKIGHAHRVSTRNDHGWVFFEESVVALAMLGVPQTLHTALTAETDTAFMLRRFAFTLTSPATTFTAHGHSNGQRLEVAYGVAGFEDTLSVPLAEPIHLASTLRSHVLAGDPAPGTRFTLPVFSPMTLGNEPMTVTVEAIETLAGPDGPVRARRLSEQHGQVRTTVWLDDDGAVLRETAALGFTLERETRAVALQGADRHAPIDLVATSRIPLDGTIADPRTVAALTLRVRGAGAATIPDQPPRQRRDADLLRVAREGLPAVVPLRANRDDSSTTLAAYLAPAPLIEVDDPAIASRARAIVGDGDDAVAAARRLVAWVHGHLAQEPSVTVPSARAVLAAGRGDCNEHAVLLTALARAAGIPARVVAGAVYANDGFYYHAWTELWLGAWISADAVFDQIPTDATHVKLMDGGPERHIALVNVIGRLAFAVEGVSS